MRPAEPRLLVSLRPLGLGDLLTAVPALRALRRAHPQHHHLLATTASLAPLAVASGAVDAVWPARPHRALLLPRPPDVAVDLHGRGPRSQRVLLAERPRRLLAFASDGVPETAGMAEWNDGEHEVRRWCRMLETGGVPADPGDLDLDPRLLPPPPQEARGATLLHPGAAFASRRWPPERFAAVARAERAAGREVAVTAGPGEEALAATVAAAAGSGTAVLAGLPLLCLAAAVAAAARIVCGDTGVAHLATALRVPSVVLFGPVPPALWGPPPDRPWHRALWAGRRGDPHGGSVDPGLLEIGVHDVLGALDRLPAAAPALREGAAAARC